MQQVKFTSDFEVGDRIAICSGMESYQFFRVDEEDKTKREVQESLGYSTTVLAVVTVEEN